MYFPLPYLPDTTLTTTISAALQTLAMTYEKFSICHWDIREETFMTTGKHTQFSCFLGKASGMANDKRCLSLPLTLSLSLALLQPLVEWVEWVELLDR